MSVEVVVRNVFDAAKVNPTIAKLEPSEVDFLVKLIADALREAGLAMEWIPVSIPPKENGHYIGRTSRDFYDVYFVDGKFYFEPEAEEEYGVVIQYWMPMQAEAVGGGE